jgi:hypothetical protein
MILIASFSVASCTPGHASADVWSLDLVELSGDVFLEVTLSHHESLDSCRQAGEDWLKEHPERTQKPECRLNCRDTANFKTVCDRTEQL